MWLGKDGDSSNATAGTTERNVTVVVGVANPAAVGEDAESHAVSRRVIGADSCARRDLCWLEMRDPSSAKGKCRCSNLNIQGFLEGFVHILAFWMAEPLCRP